jgi:hypothetical protein
MKKGSKAQIKKLIEELHAKRTDGHSPKARAEDQTKGAGGFKGAKKSGTYRPKI